MKRWKKGLSLLLAVCLAGSLCACGNDGGNTAPQDPTPPPAEDVPQEVDVPEEDFSEPEPEPEFEPEPEPEPEPQPEPKGLVILDSTIVKGNANTQEGCTIYCLDPDTGESTVIADFNCKIGFDLGEYFYYLPFSANTYSFSEDYTKIAVTKRFKKNGENHAGWLDQSGNFFDVTEALGQQSKSDFDDPVDYIAVGFSNGCFGFSQILTGSNTTNQYYIPVDNVVSAALQTGDVRQKDHPYNEEGALLMGQYSGEVYPNDVTSWIDATHAVVNKVEYSVYSSWIVDTAAQTLSAYVPGDSRENWNGRVSPDGTQIAFLSAPKGVYRPEVDLYIISVNGGDPVKVEGHPFLFARIAASFENPGTCTLIGWK